MIYEYTLDTPKEGSINITRHVREALSGSGARSGLCVVYTPHTTAGLTINENADPDVQHDLLLGLANAFPEQSAFRHFEGNSTAHLKASTLGASQTLIIQDGALLLGRWQSVFFFEFDGPRRRKFYVKILKD